MPNCRIYEISRKTKETDITIILNLDGDGLFVGSSGNGFFDHMLNSFAVHSGFDINLTCHGDLEVDCHHTVEDVGIVLGTCFLKALADKSNIARYGSFYIPMDESLSLAAVDISARPYLVFNASFNDSQTGNFDTCLVEEFFKSFAYNAGITLHINLIYGSNTHHAIESIFKAVAHSLKEAVKLSQAKVLSSKGII